MMSLKNLPTRRCSLQVVAVGVSYLSEIM